MKEKTKKILQWVFSVFCILAAIVYLPSFASVLLLLAGAGCMPVKPVNSLWEKIPVKAKALKMAAIAVLFLWGCMAAPDLAQTDTDAVVSVQDSETVESAAGSRETAELEYAGGKTETESVPASATESVEADESTGVTESTEEAPEENSESPAVVETQETGDAAALSFDFASVPAYSGDAYAVVNGNVPFFGSADLEAAAVSYESYAALDAKGRCGVCVASVGTDIMPTEERGEIGSVKPSGWNQAKYPGVVDGNYLYNRCHLIGYQLTGENANTRNLITGTRYLNVEGMLPFENMVADYVKETGNHVLYRVTPVFENDNLVASGVLMEAESVEDGGDGILFCVYCYNVQPGVTIDYSNGASALTDEAASGGSTDSQQTQESETAQQPSQETSQETDSGTGKYAVNANNGKIHIVGGCSATGTGDNAMNNPVYFDTYEEAESYSIQIAPNLSKRQCGNCW